MIAPDSFKGTFTAQEVAVALGAGFRSVGYEADLCPIADGGEGTTDALLEDGRLVRATAQDPLGRPVEAVIAMRDGVGIVETAAASGLGLVAPAERDPIRATTFGTGELISSAVAAGAKTVYLGVGGSATTDGGAGAIAALTARGGLRGARLIVLCDVDTTFEHAAEVFAPQKGANPVQVAELTRRLHTQAGSYSRDPRGVRHTGAAGGLAGGLWATFGAELVAGAGFVLDAVGFDERCRAAAAVVTGEGRLDEQSHAGKAVSEVAGRARRLGVSCYAVVGSLALSGDGSHRMGLTDVRTGTTLPEIEAAARELGLNLTRL